MRSAHTVAQVRAAEEARMRELPEGALMQQAAAGLAAATFDLLGRSYGVRVLLLVGPGDNGGDALWAGARLARRGAQVQAILVAERAHGEGLAALVAAGGRVVTAGSAAAPDVVIDGILGIGGRAGLDEPTAAIVRQFAHNLTVAVDVPSGVGVDTGVIDGPHVEADLTVTFGTYKPAHLVGQAAAACGVIELVELGLELPPAAITALQPEDVARLVPAPGLFAHKYTRGVVGVRAGSATYPGAAVLCVAGAACGLAGMVRYEGAARGAVLADFPEVVAAPGRVQSWVVGSGGAQDAAAALTASVDAGVPVLVDASALEHVEPGQAAVLTPHAGELARMLGLARETIEAEQLRSAREAAARYDAVVLLKGWRTLIARPDGRVRVTTVGTPWLATAGAGDVLSGVIGALLAAGLDPWDAASVGSWLHASAATYASGGGMLRAMAVAEAIPAVIAGLSLGG